MICHGRIDLPCEIWDVEEDGILLATRILWPPHKDIDRIVISLPQSHFPASQRRNNCSQIDKETYLYCLPLKGKRKLDLEMVHWQSSVTGFSLPLSLVRREAMTLNDIE